MEEKTYSKKNLKFLSLLLLILLFSVILLLYLILVAEFSPITDGNSYNWTNILTFFVLFSSSIFSFVSLVLYISLKFLFKKQDCRELKIVCIKWSILFTLGLLLVIILNFFHILSIYWGIGILFVAIIASFII